AVELRSDQLLGLPGDSVLEPAVQPVRVRLLRSLDPAVEILLSRRPLRRSAERALPCRQLPSFLTSNGLPTARCSFSGDTRISAEPKQHGVNLAEWQRCP